MKKYIKWIPVFLLVIALSGCGLIPEEEVYQKSPRIQSETPVEYKLTYVVRGDVADTETITCKYRSVREETLSFRVGGEYLDGVYVEKGDQVTAGQLLASLQMESLRDEENRLDLELERQMLLRVQLIENEADALNRLKVEYLNEPGYDEALISHTEEYGRRIAEAEDQIEYTSLRLQELRDNIAKRQLIATIDGTVMYVRSLKEWEQSVEGDRFIRIADTTESVFVGETLYPEIYKEGEILEITFKSTAYPVRVALASSLGIEPTAVEEGKKTEVFFVPLEFPPEIEDGDRAQMTLIRQERKDTLYVPNNTILEIDGREAVYGLDEYGFKTIRYVTTGLRASNYTEILEGLSEGEAIIAK